MNHKKIIANSSFSVIHIVINSCVLFFLYRFLIRTIGVESLGIWSLVFATTSVTGIAQFGLTGSVVKFVAKYKAHDDLEKAGKIIETAFITILVLFAAILILFFPLARKILLFVVDSPYHSNALLLLPFALTTIWITSISGVIQSGIDGCQQIAGRTVITSACSLIYFFCCLCLVPKYGLHGLAYSQIIQAVLLLFSYYILLKLILPQLPILPITWNWRCFKEIFPYGSNFQLISLMSMLLDPLTKVLISKFGNIGYVAYYEMAYKLVSHVRSLIISANSVIVPAIADQVEKFPANLERYYRYNMSIILSISLPIFGSVMILSPTISDLWIGHREYIFVLFLMVLSLGWLSNTISAPAYFFYLGIGKLRWNLISHTLIAVLNLLFGYILGSFYGASGVALANCLSLIIGSIVVFHSYHASRNISYRAIFSSYDIVLVLIYSMVIFVSISMLCYLPSIVSSGFLSLIAISILLVSSIYLSYVNPASRYLLKSLKNLI